MLALQEQPAESSGRDVRTMGGQDGENQVKELFLIRTFSIVQRQPSASHRRTARSNLMTPTGGTTQTQ